MRSGEGRRRVLVWSVRWLALALLWLALADSRARPELIAAAVAALIGASLASLISRPGRPRTLTTAARLFALGPRRLAYPMVRLVLDNGLLVAVLWRRLVRGERASGTLRTGPMPSDPALQSAAGRVAVEAWGSLTPNRYVIGIDEETGTVLVHELTRSRTPVVPLTGR
jgi:multisubunit Na+/H+ antiporter MnhE subunit